MDPTKEILLKNILRELYQMPEKYLNGIYDIIHNLRTTLIKAESESMPMNDNIEYPGPETFDWDSFIAEVNQNRINKNKTMDKNIGKLFD